MRLLEKSITSSLYNSLKESEEFEVGELKKRALDILPKEDIDTHDSDLYIKKSDASTELINNMKYKDSGLLSTFTDDNGDVWYDIPFANMEDDYKEKLKESSNADPTKEFKYQNFTFIPVGNVKANKNMYSYLAKYLDDMFDDKFSYGDFYKVAPDVDLFRIKELDDRLVIPGGSHMFEYTGGEDTYTPVGELPSVEELNTPDNGGEVGTKEDKEIVKDILNKKMSYNDISSKQGYGINKYQLYNLANLYVNMATKDVREKIEDFLTDINFHSECSELNQDPEAFRDKLFAELNESCGTKEKKDKDLKEDIESDWRYNDEAQSEVIMDAYIQDIEDTDNLDDLRKLVRKIYKDERITDQDYDYLMDNQILAKYKALGFEFPEDDSTYEVITDDVDSFMANYKETPQDTISGEGLTKYLNYENLDHADIDMKNRMISFYTVPATEDNDGYLCATVDFLNKVDEYFREHGMNVNTYEEGESAFGDGMFTIRFEEVDEPMNESDNSDSFFKKAQAYTSLNNFQSMGIIVDDSGDTVKYFYSNEPDKEYEAPIEYDEELEGIPYFKDESGNKWTIDTFLRTDYMNESTLISGEKMVDAMCSFIGDLFNNEAEGFKINAESLYDWCEGGDSFYNAGYNNEECKKLINLMNKINPLVQEINKVLDAESLNEAEEPKRMEYKNPNAKCYWVDLDVRKGDSNYSDNISSQTVGVFDTYKEAMDFAMNQSKIIGNHLPPLEDGKWYEYTIREVLGDDEWDDIDVVAIEGQNAPITESAEYETPELTKLVKKEIEDNGGRFPDEIKYKGKTYKCFNVMSPTTAGDRSLVYYCNMKNTPSGDPQESNDYFFVNAGLKLNPDGNGFKGVREVNYVEDLTEAVEEESSAKKKFEEYCKGKIKALGTVEVETDDWDSDKENAKKKVKVKVALTQKIRNYGECKVLDGSDTIEKLDSDGETLEFVTEKGKYINTPMTDMFGLIARLEFDAISRAVYNSTLEYWDDLNMDEYFDGDTLEESVNENNNWKDALEKGKIINVSNKPKNYAPTDFKYSDGKLYYRTGITGNTWAEWPVNDMEYLLKHFNNQVNDEGATITVLDNENVNNVDFDKVIDNDMSIKELDDTAQWLYDTNRDEWDKFTDNEMRELANLVGKYGRAYDDEVYNELDRRGITLQESVNENEDGYFTYPEDIKPYLDVELEDDNSTPNGGTAFAGETVRDFIETNYKNLDELNTDLVACGILPVGAKKPEQVNESAKPKKKSKKKKDKKVEEPEKRVIMQQGNVTCFKENDNTYYVFENENDNEVEYSNREDAMNDFFKRVGVDPNREIKGDTNE